MNRTNRTDDPITDREPTTMGEVSHTHPHADRGTVNRPFERGPVVAADGGRREAYDADAREEEQEEDDGDHEHDRMKDVNHTPPHGDGVDRVFERGRENEAVESEE
ncbi:hypothetical protein [Halorussus salinisoli]|uniref:hypothetical protein n=1 Tax=Halorussus salinisoli TaxID=2558242 RepID=UPI002A90E1F1|nr:hypothetical protein [Halorussus salinisoli]